MNCREVGASHTAGPACSHPTTGVSVGSAVRGPLETAVSEYLTSYDEGTPGSVVEDAVEADDPGRFISRGSNDRLQTVKGPGGAKGSG